MKRVCGKKILWSQLLGLCCAILLMGCHDKINFENKGGEVGFLLDAADAAGDFIDRTYRTNDSVFRFNNNVLERVDGNDEEIVAFSEGRPPSILNPVHFTQSENDVATVTFENNYPLDFTVWIVDVNNWSTVKKRTKQTIDGLAYAEERWRVERVGLSIGYVRFVDSTHDPQAKAVRDCTSYPDLASDIGFDPGRINIYLTRKAADSRYMGETNRIGGDQVCIGMYAGAGDTLLMHEFAHSFSLEHTDHQPDFDSSNVARGGFGQLIGGRRQHFTEGQTFRVHYNAASAINSVYHKRPNQYVTATNCGHSTIATLTCPAVQKRIWSDGNLPPN